MRALVIAVVIAACAPAIDTPLAQQRAIDRQDARALAAQLGHLPGVIAADAILERPVSDPLVGTTTRAAAAIALVVDASADRPALTGIARERARAVAPEIPEPAVVVVLGAGRPALAHLGPFIVAARDRTALVSLLAAAFALAAAAAGYVAWRERR